MRWDGGGSIVGSGMIPDVSGDFGADSGMGLACSGVVFLGQIGDVT